MCDFLSAGVKHNMRAPEVKEQKLSSITAECSHRTPIVRLEIISRCCKYNEEIVQ